MQVNKKEVNWNDCMPPSFYYYCNKENIGACKMAQWIKPLAGPDNISSNPRTHVNVEGENQLHKGVSSIRAHIYGIGGCRSGLNMLCHGLNTEEMTLGQTQPHLFLPSEGLSALAKPTTLRAVGC